MNRVHPETGKAAALSNDHLELSKWAEEYERRHGKIRCEERVANNARRRERKANGRNGFVKHAQKINTADFRRWQRGQRQQAGGPALELNVPAWHRDQRQTLYDKKEQRIELRRAQIKQKDRATWAFLFRQQKQELRELDETRRSAFKALLYFVQHRHELKAPGGLRWTFEGLRGIHGAEFAGAMRARHDAARKQLAGRVKAEIREAIAQENEQFQTELDILRHEQAAERKTLRESYADHMRQPGREITGGSDARPTDKAPEKEADTVKEEFAKRVGKRIRRERKRAERKRGKDAGRERED